MVNVNFLLVEVGQGTVFVRSLDMLGNRFLFTLTFINLIVLVLFLFVF